MVVASRTPPPRQDNNDDISICLLLMDFPERTSLSLNKDIFYKATTFQHENQYDPTFNQPSNDLNIYLQILLMFEDFSEKMVNRKI